jgi:hypothetical protein
MTDKDAVYFHSVSDELQESLTEATPLRITYGFYNINLSGSHNLNIITSRMKYRSFRGTFGFGCRPKVRSLTAMNGLNIITYDIQV